MRNLLHVAVHAANIHDTIAGGKVVKGALEKYHSLQGVCGDAGYLGTFVREVKALGLNVDISERIKPVFEIIPKRWQVERTFSWMNNSRRLFKDYEINTETAVAMTVISHIATLLNRFR